MCTFYQLKYAETVRLVCIKTTVVRCVSNTWEQGFSESEILKQIRGGSGHLCQDILERPDHQRFPKTGWGLKEGGNLGFNESMNREGRVVGANFYSFPGEQV